MSIAPPRQRAASPERSFAWWACFPPDDRVCVDPFKDYVFAVFRKSDVGNVEVSTAYCAPETLWERISLVPLALLDTLIRAEGSFAHAELMLMDGMEGPCGERRKAHYGTYKWEGANWQSATTGFYELGTWHAVPVQLPVSQVRSRCDLERHAPYSLRQYPLALPPFKWGLASLADSGVKAKAQCASLVSRILGHTGMQGVGASPSERYTSLHASPAGFSPSGLYTHLCKTADSPGAPVSQTGCVSKRANARERLHCVYNSTNLGRINYEDLKWSVQVIIYSIETHGNHNPEARQAAEIFLARLLFMVAMAREGGRQ